MNDPDSDLPPELKRLLVQHQAPPGLRRRVRFMLDQHTQPLEPLRFQRPARSWFKDAWAGRRTGPWLNLGAGLALGLVSGVMLSAGWLHVQSQDNVAQQFSQQLLANHVRSLMLDHKIDIASSDQHTVKPWFIGKLDYAPVVIDLAAAGFPLLGGRLDYLDGRSVAVLVYGRGRHVVNLFVRPDGNPASSQAPASAATRQGYNMLGWSRTNMQFWAVSDANSGDLWQFMTALREAQQAPAAAPVGARSGTGAN